MVSERGETDRARFLLDQMRTLAAGPSAWGRSRDVGEQLAAALGDARRSLRCEGGALYTRDGDGLVLRVVQHERVDPKVLAAQAGAKVPVDGASVAGHVASTAELLAADDAYALAGTPCTFDPRLDHALGVRTQAIVAAPLRVAAGAIGVLELTNPALSGTGAPAVFTPEQQEAAGALAALVGAVVETALERARGREAMLEAAWLLGGLAEFQDQDINGHVRRISGYSAAVARSAGCDPDTVEQVRLASSLHDVGKIAIPPSILHKPGKLTDDEFAITKGHTEVGASLLRAAAAPALRLAADVALSHHERWDGTGYPRGLKGEGIPLAARIVAIVDVFDALTTRRTYKPAMGVEQSMRIVCQESGKHFDPKLVEAFRATFTEVLDVKARFTTS